MSWGLVSDSELTVDFDADGRGWPDPWPAVFEFAHEVSSDHWALIGGLMVQFHCLLRGEEPARATRDMDVLSRVEVTWRTHLSEVRSGLSRLGYIRVEPSGRGQPLHRMRRVSLVDGVLMENQADFLIADHVPPKAQGELPNPLPVQAPGGRNALSRLQLAAVDSGEAGAVLIAVPDLVGALQLKLEAYFIDSRGAARHLADAVTLAGLVSETESFKPLRGSAAQRLRRLQALLSSDEQLLAAGVDRDSAVDAYLAVQSLLTGEIGV